MNREQLLHPFRFAREHRLTCHHASEYLDGELSAKDAARVERHARWCPMCHEMLASLRRTIAAVRGLHDVPAGAGAPTDAIIARLRDEP